MRHCDQSPCEAARDLPLCSLSGRRSGRCTPPAPRRAADRAGRKWGADSAAAQCTFMREIQSSPSRGPALTDSMGSFCTVARVVASTPALRRRAEGHGAPRGGEGHSTFSSSRMELAGGSAQGVNTVGSTGLTNIRYARSARRTPPRGAGGQPLLRFRHDDVRRPSGRAPG